MHAATKAIQPLEFMWNNYLTICENIDPETMSGETLDYHIQHNSPVRPYRISAWLARQGHFIASWAIWEYYSRCLCLALTNKEKKAGDESTVDWVARSLNANNMDFVDPIWFFERKLPEESHRPLRG